MSSQKTEIRKQSCILLLSILSDHQFNDHSSLDNYKILSKLIKIASKDQNEVIISLKISDINFSFLF